MRPLPSPHTPHWKKKVRSAAPFSELRLELSIERAGSTLPVTTQETQGRRRQATKSWPQPRRHPRGAKESTAGRVALQAGGERAPSSCGPGPGPVRELASLDAGLDTGALSPLLQHPQRSAPAFYMPWETSSSARLPATRPPWNLSALTKT